MRTSMRILWLAVFFGTAHVAAQPRDVTVRAPDGAPLAATYFQAAERGPAVLLLHQCNMTRTSWTRLGLELAAKGIHVLAPDYRGAGDNHFLSAEYSKRGGDIDAALNWLLTQPNADPAHVAVGGASCGVDHAVQLARRDDRIDALMLLSGATDVAGTTFVRTTTIPVFFAFSTDEGGPLPALADAIRRSNNSATRVRELAGAGHGAPMFDHDPSLLSATVGWLVEVLR